MKYRCRGLRTSASSALPAMVAAAGRRTRPRCRRCALPPPPPTHPHLVLGAAPRAVDPQALGSLHCELFASGEALVVDHVVPSGIPAQGRGRGGRSRRGLRGGTARRCVAGGSVAGGYCSAPRTRCSPAHRSPSSAPPRRGRAPRAGPRCGHGCPPWDPAWAGWRQPVRRRCPNRPAGGRGVQQLALATVRPCIGGGPRWEGAALPRRTHCALLTGWPLFQRALHIETQLAHDPVILSEP